LKEIVRKNVLAFFDGVLNDYAHCGSASKRVDATQACWGNGHSGFFSSSAALCDLCVKNILNAEIAEGRRERRVI